MRVRITSEHDLNDQAGEWTFNKRAVVRRENDRVHTVPTIATNILGSVSYVGRPYCASCGLFNDLKCITGTYIRVALYGT